MEEIREKIELFRNYYLVCFRSFDQDPYSPTHLEPLNMYIIVFREGILSASFILWLLSAIVMRLIIHSSSTSTPRLTLKMSVIELNNSKITSMSPPTGFLMPLSTTSPMHLDL